MLDLLPDSLLLCVFNFLHPEDISRVGRCCSKLRRVSHDNIHWKKLFHSYFKIPTTFRDPIGSDTWRDEFIRLVDQTPLIEAQVLTKHTDQVLHVSFSHDGTRFATCSKDAKVYVWKSCHPVELEYTYDMQAFTWKYTQFSQFNESDTLLLVSGVLFGQHSTSGEIAVFSLTDGFHLQCRVPSKPYDIFGAWYSDNFLISGALHWLANFVSKSVIWLNKASQEVHSEHAAISNKLFQFYNPKASSIRSVMIANCVQDSSSIEDEQKQYEPGAQTVSNDATVNHVADIGYLPEHHKSRDKLNSTCPEPDSSRNTRKQALDEGSGSSSPIKSDEKRQKITSSSCDSTMETNVSTEPDSILLDVREKWLIFTCGSQTYSPHQVGFKKIKPVNFQCRIEPGPSIRERREELRRRRMMEEAGEEEEAVDYTDYPKVAGLFDQSDVVIDLHGHIIGMALSPDHRYLYVNSRPWPTGYSISDPLEPPPIAQEIDIHLIDLSTLTQVGMMRRGNHRAYTPNEECFFIFLDAADLYLASGSEDKHCYVWDRKYTCPLYKLPHTDVVNAVAFNPTDSRMLVSVSDDRTIKVWRSKDQCRELKIPMSNIGKKLYLQQR